jgi:hypothetical protein
METALNLLNFFTLKKDEATVKSLIEHHHISLAVVEAANATKLQPIHLATWHGSIGSCMFGSSASD